MKSSLVGCCRRKSCLIILNVQLVLLFLGVYSGDRSDALVAKAPFITTGLEPKVSLKDSVRLFSTGTSLEKGTFSKFIENPFQPFGANPPSCLRQGFLMDFPMSTREQELRRVYAIVDTVMRKYGAMYWPADGTLLGIIRHGRVPNDLDLDFHVMTTMDDCLPLLASMKSAFKEMANLTHFRIKVRREKRGTYKKVAMYAMVRVAAKFGSLNTGADISCVYHQPNGSYTTFNHFGRLIQLPNNTFPLAPCRVYDMTVLCPNNGYSLLQLYKPRYDGCLVFPHCFGDPELPQRRCSTPHPHVPLVEFLKATATLQRCGYVSLADHFATEPLCSRLMEETERSGMDCCGPNKCNNQSGKSFCFLQPFNG